tara:strand:+ start:291 stop:2504 length:2214 start_codon:yes stop_codon:yes gene_type:complete
MAEKIISPGVFTKEIDASFLPSAIADIGACVIGPTVRGPALVPTVVESFNEYQKVFGTTFTSGSKSYQYLTSHAAENYLKNGGPLTVVRILAGSYSGATATVSSSLDPAILGGGTQGVGKFTIGNFNAALHASGVSASIGATTFIVTGSGLADSTKANSATTIYMASQSSIATTATVFANTINHSASLHGLEISASYTATEVSITASNPGVPFGDHIFGGAHMQNPDYSNTHYSMSSGNTGWAQPTQLAGGTNFSTTYKIPFKLHTLSDGDTMNSAGTAGSSNILTEGTKNNFRYEISNVNYNKGTFALTLRAGNDTETQKQILESWTNVSLDPNSTNYIAKAIGDQYNTIATDENGNPFLKLVGDYPQKSKYVRVEVVEKTVDYLDENGNVRVPAASASLPHYSGSSTSGSDNGAFSGGSDGTVQHPIGHYTYENISENNSQGLDPSGDGAAKGYNEYIQALDLISNQDEYDINLILTPGILDSVHTAVSKKVIDVCEARGDCFAIIDPCEFAKNVSDATDRGKARNSNYAGMYWPWVMLPDSQLGVNRWVPASVGVSGVYSFNDKVAHPWFAPAGLNRGTIDVAVQAERKLTHSDRDSLYDNSVNPIATFPGSGVTIFGQKTLQKKASALDRINVRRLLIKVKKFIASSSRFLVFEQNTAATRRRFLNIAQPFLEQVQSQSGLSAFRVVMDETNNTPDTIDRNQLVGQIFLQPTRTAEFIVLDFTVQRTGAAFPE